MTPREANHNSHVTKSPLLSNGGHRTTCHMRLTRKIRLSREKTILRRAMSQSGTVDTSFCVSFVRRTTDFSRVGCFNQSTTFRIRTSSSVDINFSLRA